MNVPAEYNPFDWYWRRSDGRVYSTRLNKELTPEEALQDAEYQEWLRMNDGWVPQYPNFNGSESRELLAETLRPYGLYVHPLDKMEAIELIQARYKPLLDELLEAYTSAVMLDDQEEASDIKQEYDERLTAMSEEIRAL